MALRCASAASFGEVKIREGRRTVDLSPVAAVTFFYDCAKAIAGPARLAQLVLDAESLRGSGRPHQRVGHPRRSTSTSVTWLETT